MPSITEERGIIGLSKVKIISWNMNQKHDAESWQWLTCTEADVALLQEAKQPTDGVEHDPGGAMLSESESNQWMISGYAKPSGRATVVRLSDNVCLRWHKWCSFSTKESGRFRVSRPGTIVAAEVLPSVDGAFEPFVVVSMYAVWENYHKSTTTGKCFADASAHRLISDLSVFLYPEKDHRVIAAGDLNILYGYGESGDDYWAGRYGSVFGRMEALGMKFIGPQYPNGQQAHPWPDELPKGSRNVPTHCKLGRSERQMDFVFASESMAESVDVWALNAPEQWGPSDHCRVEINVTTKVS